MVEHKDEVVISGIGGLYPEANNIEELKNLLFNKMNGVTLDSRRWEQNELGIRSGTGKMKNVDDFDAMFFKAHPKLAIAMDIITKLSLERSIEAIIDAGLSPADLNGTNAGVFMCSTISETEMLFLDGSQGSEFTMLGQSRTMQANRLSYILNLTGPSFAMDGGWICSSESLEKAKKMIENGFITSAIVGVTNLCLRPELQYQFQGLNRLNQGNSTKSFSVDADGYNRSEACIVMLLQKSSEAKRSYCTLLNVNSMQFGDSQKHITERDGIHFKSLLLDSYKKVNINPVSVEYIEAHGSGLKNEDSIELNVMEEVFCNGQRKAPLKVGSVKSNVGHCEVSGLFMSIVKAIIALDSGYIPPNINYTEPNENITAIKNGNIQIVTEKTPLVSDIIGISSFGLSNAFSHVILKRNNKAKFSFEDTENKDLTPRLILASGRNEENARETVNMIMKHGNDSEYLALTYEVFTKNISTHFHRCYSIFPSLNGPQINDIGNVSLKKRPVWFIFSGMGSQWLGMGLDLMKFPIFADAIEKCDLILKPLGVDLKNILTSLNEKLFDNILNSFVGIAAIQIGLVNMLKALDIVPDGIIGHSVGELGCAYADGCFTAEEMLLSAYARGRASLETNLIPGMMAAVGLGYHQIKDRLPQDIDVACHNSASSCTISGPVNSIDAFVSQLKSEGVFAKTVNVAGIAYHSRYIQSAGPTLMKYLKEVIKEPKPRSSKWISTSLPDSEWNSDLAKYSSAEYHTNNLLNSVLFEDALKHIPSDAIVIEIAPHGLLQAIIKRALPDTVSSIPLTKKILGESVQLFLNAVGKMYLCGLNPIVQQLYPKVTFPVSRGTPSMSILPFWDHTQQWSQRAILNKVMNFKSSEKFTILVLSNETHLIEYQIHGHYIIPPSYMLFDVWKLFVEMNSKTINSEQVQFQNLRFKNNIEIHSTHSCEKYIMIQQASGLFEYNIDDELVFSGQISFLDKKDLNTKSIQPITLDKISDINEGYVLKDEIYSMFDNNGYCLGDNYKNIMKYDISEKRIQGYVKWTNDWVYFIDGLLKFSLLEDLETQKLNAPISIREIKINPLEFQKIQEKDVYVSNNKAINEINCVGVKISDVKNSSLLLPEIKSTVVEIEEKQFVQFNHSTCQNIDEFISDSMNIILETDRFNLETVNKKLIVCTPYHYNDSIFKACTKSLKQILDSQLSVDTLTLTWDNIKNTTEYDESGRFITVTNDNFISDTIKVLASKKCSYVIVYSDQKLQDLKNWKIIMQQRLNDISYLAIIKKDTVFDENNVFVKQNYDDYDLSIWRTLEKCKLSTGIIYIVSKSEPLEGVNNYVKNMLLKYKSQRLRFLFILDSNAPDFNSNKSFYKNQLVKGFMINIYKNGGWGFYKRNSVQVLNEKMNLIENPIVKNITINSENLHSVQFLGLNYKDLVVENSTENEFGPLDYSCFAKNDKLFMGIASFEQKSSKIKYDSVLLWPVPSTWSPEDATTVPLTYAIAYYVFYVLCSLRKDNSILITSGLHPIGQAAIAISLDKKCDTYAVVESSQDVKLLSNIFPELPRSRILVNTNNKFDIRVMLMTKSKGVNIVLNFLSGEAFQAAFRTIAYHGKFFHFSKSDMKIHSSIGTQVFLRNTSFTAIGSSMLLNESDQNKRIVHLAVMDALNKGVIKPFSRFDLTTSSRSRNIFDTMRTASTLTTPQKVVLSVSDELRNFKPLDYSICNKYQCDPDQVNVIVGNCNKLDWLDVAKWLVDRGARNIVIVIKRCLILSVISRRLLSRNLSIQVEPDMHLMTKEESLNWLNRLTSFRVLGSLFIINQLNCKKVDNLRYAFQNNKNKSKMTSFVCISSNGEIVCANLKSIGLKALNISLDETSSQPKSVSRMLLSLDTILQCSNTKNSSSYIWSEKATNKSEWSQKMNEVIANYIPNSIDDVYNLNELINKDAGFAEVQTGSPRFSQLKSVTPVFVIPGFRPKLFESLYKQFCYPVFEARLPERVESIDELSNILVKEVKSISNNGSVSLVGESWGGFVALKMAQILEAQGTLVTVSLLNGDPKTVISWAKCFLTKDHSTETLNGVHNYCSDEFSKFAAKTDEEDLQTVKLTVQKKSSEENTRKSLNWIRSILRMSLETKPLSNKLHTKVLMFKCEGITEPHKINDLIDYCDNQPYVHIVPGTDYKQMMADKEMIKILANNVVYTNAEGNEISLIDKYKNFYFYDEKLKRGI